MSFFDKPARNLLESDLQWLADNRIREGDRVDFKRDMYGGDDENRRELLRDVTALANHRGGRIVIGMDETDDNEAKELVGIEPGDHITWIRSLCLPSIDGRILGLDIVEIPLASGRMAVVIDAPLTAGGPHMITFKGLNQFWKRHGRQKAGMSIEEIRDGFLRVADSQARLENFLIQRNGDAIEQSAGTCMLVLSAIPIYFRDEPILDVRLSELQSLASDPPKAGNGAGQTVSCGRLHPTLEGVGAWMANPNEPRSLQVFRNGYIEFTSAIGPDPTYGLMYAGVYHSDLVVSFAGFSAEVYTRFLGSIPMVLRAVIINALGLCLAGAGRVVDQTRRWPRQHLDLGRYVLEDPAQGWRSLPKQVCDRLWNAFGYEQCNLLDETATFK